MPHTQQEFDANYDQGNKQLGLSAMSQMFSQAEQRYTNGMKANMDIDYFGKHKGTSYTYGF